MRYGYSEIEKQLNQDQFTKNNFILETFWNINLQINDTSFIAQSYKINKFTSIIFYAS